MFSYQAAAVDASGKELTQTAICIRASIISNSFNGVTEWMEVHSGIFTDEFGLFTIEIGAGTPIGGAQSAFSNIKWGETRHYLKVEMSLDPQCSNFVLSGVNQLLSVPYALFSEKAGSAATAINATYADTSIYAELSNVAFYSDTALFAQFANFSDTASVTNIAYNSYHSDTALFAMTTINNLNDDDPDPTNELQNLSLSGSNLTLSGSNAPPIDLNASDPDHDPTNELQNLSLSGSNLTLSGSNAPPIDLNASDPDHDPTNEIQNLSANGSLLSLSGSNAPPVDMNVSDPDHDPTNELQGLVFDSVSSTLSLTQSNIEIDLTNLSNFNASGSDLDFPQGVAGVKYMFVPDELSVPSDSVFYLVASEDELRLPTYGNNFGRHLTGPNLPVFKPGTQVDNCRCIGFFKQYDPFFEPVIFVLNPNQTNFFQVPFNRNLVIKSGLDQTTPITLNGFTISPFGSIIKAFVIPEGVQIKNLGNDEVIVTGYLIKTN
jgi:hypothetical protein